MAAVIGILSPLGVTVTEMRPSGHVALGSICGTDELDPDVPQGTRSSSNGVKRLQLSITPLICSSIREEFARLITTFSRAAAQETTKNMEIMLRNAKMTR